MRRIAFWGNTLINDMASSGLTPNMVTAIGFGLCLLAGLAAVTQLSLVVVALIYALGCSCDMLDGQLARRRPVPSGHKFGALFDTLADRGGEAALLLSLLFRTDSLGTAQWIALAGWIGFLATFIKTAAGEKSAVTTWPEIRIFGRAARAIATILSLLVIGVTHWPESFALQVFGQLFFTLNLTMLISRLHRVFQEYQQQRTR